MAVQLKYPVLLVHGMGFRDDKRIGYWGRIPQMLEQMGCRVFFGNQDSNGDTQTNGSVLAGRMEDREQLLVLLDYSAPKYRDCSVGKYLYAALAQKGFQRLKTGTQVEKHARYLRKMGFTEAKGCFTLTLPHN